MSTSISYLLVAALAAMLVIGDYFIKLASLETHPIQNKWFVLGSLIYASSAFAWVFVMQHIKLSSLGLVYSLFTVILLAALGVLVFGESLNRYEAAGMALGIASILLLARFGG